MSLFVDKVHVNQHCDLSDHIVVIHKIHLSLNIRTFMLYVVSKWHPGDKISNKRHVYMSQTLANNRPVLPCEFLDESQR